MFLLLRSLAVFWVFVGLKETTQTSAHVPWEGRGMERCEETCRLSLILPLGISHQLFSSLRTLGDVPGTIREQG